MSKMICLVGVPGSGKTTYRKESCLPYVCRDEIRTKLFGKPYKFSKAKEQAVTEYRDDEIDRIINLLNSDVIVDETCCNRKSRDALVKLAEEIGAEIEWKIMEDSFDVDLCHKRNVQRQDSVPYEVIERMFVWFIDFVKDLPEYGWIPNRVNKNGAVPAIIVDVDGTLADHKGVRSPFDWDKVALDKPKDHIIDLVNSYCEKTGCEMIVMSGRDGSCRNKTLQWLDRWDVEYDHLFMREAGDSRKDFRIKMELFQSYVQDHFDIQMVVDDRNQVSRYWEAIGLNLVKVGWDGFF